MNAIRLLSASIAVVALVLGVSLADDTSLKSGPQVDQKVPGPFHPLNVTGEAAGKKNCLYCQNGDHPVAMIFARKPSEPLTKLIKKIDTCTAKHGECQMGSFVVFLSDAEGLEKQLKDMAEKESIKHCVLSIDNPAGPQAYKIAPEADVTVVLYTGHVVKANHAYRPGELKTADIDQIVSDVGKILPQK